MNFAELLNEAAENSARLRIMSDLALSLLSLLFCRSCDFVGLLLGLLEQCKSLGTVCGPANSCRAAQESLAGEQGRGESGHDPCAMSNRGVNTLEPFAVSAECQSCVRANQAADAQTQRVS